MAVPQDQSTGVRQPGNLRMIQATATSKPLWGHALAIWDTGRSIRVRNSTIKTLHRMGMTIRRRAILSPEILLLFKDAMDDPIVHELYMELGPDLSGAAWLICKCEGCRDRRELGDSRLSSIRVDQVVDTARGHRV